MEYHRARALVLVNSEVRQASGMRTALDLGLFAILRKPTHWLSLTVYEGRIYK